MKKYSERVESSTDVEALRAIVHSVENRVCWRASLSYGGEAVLRLLDSLPDPIPGKYTYVPGEHIVETRGSRFILSEDATVLVDLDQFPQIPADISRFIRDKLAKLVGCRVRSAQVSSDELDLTLMLDNGIVLWVKNEHEEPEPSSQEDKIAGWELTLPNSSYIGVWPDRRWTLTSYVSRTGED